MITIFRKHQQWLMILVTILVIVSFVVFYNYNRGSFNDMSGTGVIAKVYDRNITRHDAERLNRQLTLGVRLGLTNVMQHLMGFDRQHVVENLIVLRHEADVLGIDPTLDEVGDAEKNLPAFDTNGAFDPQKYALFVDEVLPPNGFTDKDLDELVADDLRLQKIKAIIDASVMVSPAEVRADYELENQMAQLSVVRFKRADFAAAVQVSDDDVKKRFDQQKDNLKSEEKRRIKFVEFAMSDEEKKLAGKERVPVLEKLKGKAEQFAQDMLVKDAKFDEVAKKNGAAVKETQLFSRSTPDVLLADAPAVAAETFHRTQQEPNSDPVRAGDGFAVLQLAEIVPSKPLTLAEAKPQIVEQIKNERADELMNTRAAEARKKIEAELKAGKSFTDAANAAGVKAEQLMPFSQAEPPKDVPDAMELLFKSTTMSEGQLSEFMPGGDGGVLVHLDKRLPVDEAKFEKEKQHIAETLLEQRRAFAFQEWLRARREAAKFQFTAAAG